MAVAPQFNRRYRKRGYTDEWDRVSREFKQRHPWCICCWAASIQRPTEIVDHIVPVADAPERLLDPLNLQPLCRECHDTIKRELERLWRAGKVKESDLDARSDVAHGLHRKLHRPSIGVDGLAIPGT